MQYARDTITRRCRDDRLVLISLRRFVFAGRYTVQIYRPGYRDRRAECSRSCANVVSFFVRGICDIFSSAYWSFQYAFSVRPAALDLLDPARV